MGKVPGPGGAGASLSWNKAALEELGPQHRVPVQQSLALAGELGALTEPLAGVEEDWERWSSWVGARGLSA